MILNTGTEFITINPNNNETLYFKWTLEELHLLNKQGNNVYFILNDFESKRTTNDLIWFKWIWIDLDMQSKDTKTSFQWPISDVLTLCNEKLWFLPTKINRTYKWFHILFKLSPDLYLLDKEQYVSLYKEINKRLGWDDKMKDITWILKVDGFIDNKKDREGFVIKNEFTNMDNEINTKIAEKILWQTIKFDTKRIEDYQTKTLKKDRSNNMIEDIDALDFINSINNNNDVFKDIYIKVNGDNIWDTSGLKIYNDGGIHRIKDFSGKNRHGNRLFLYNYVIKELMWITDFKEKESAKKIWKIMGFLSNEFGIKFNKSLSKKPITNSFIEQTFRNNKMELDDEVYKELTHQKLVETYNATFSNNSDRWMILKVIVWLQKYEQENKLNFMKGEWVDEEKFLKTLNLSNKTENKQKIRHYLLSLSYIKMEVPVEETIWNNRLVKWFKYKNIYEYWLGKDRFWKIYYNIKMFLKPKKKIFLPTEILSLKQWNHFNLAYTITTWIEEFKTITIPMEEIYLKLETENIKTIKEFCEKIKSRNIIKWYEINKSNIKFW